MLRYFSGPKVLRFAYAQPNGLGMPQTEDFRAEGPAV